MHVAVALSTLVTAPAATSAAKQSVTGTPNAMNYFDTDHVHTLINAAEEERVTLSLDLVMNDWLANWMQENLTVPVNPSPIVPTESVKWKWNALRNGVIRTD